jgi:L-ascorbate metabolism protein UlaG (beta-lactamase superfamily)
MIAACQKDDALLADIAVHRTLRNGFRLWWLGQSGFLLQYRGRHALFDPYLSDSLTRKYANTDKPHVRMTERVIDPARLGFIDVATSSHNHTDHLDAETLLPVIKANPALKLVIPEANRAFVAERLGCDPQWPIGLNDGASVCIGEFEFHGVASAHERLDETAEGLYPYLGYVVKFGGYSVYHSGDTVLYAGLVEKLRAHEVDVAMLPINGSLPERRVAGNLWGGEAARLAFDAGVKVAVPCHYGMFEFNTASPEEFAAECERLGQKFRLLRNGEGFDFCRGGAEPGPLS